MNHKVKLLILTFSVSVFTACSSQYRYAKNRKKMDQCDCPKGTREKVTKKHHP